MNGCGAKKHWCSARDCLSEAFWTGFSLHFLFLSLRYVDTNLNRLVCTIVWSTLVTFVTLAISDFLTMITKKHVTLEWKPVIMRGHWLNDNDNHDNKFFPRRVLPPRRTPLCRCAPLKQVAMIVAATKARCRRCRLSSSSLIQDDHHRHYWIELWWWSILIQEEEADAVLAEPRQPDEVAVE